MKIIFVILAVLFVIGGLFYFKSQKFGFEYRYVIKAQVPEIWQEVKLSLTNSQLSRIWPNKLEVLKAPSFTEGQVVQSQMFIQDKQYPVEFLITHITPNQKVEFKPKDPNFQGSDSISVKALDSDTVELVWAGEYKVKQLTLGTLFFKYYYLSKFYDEFYKNVQAYWPIKDASKKVY